MWTGDSNRSNSPGPRSAINFGHPISQTASIFETGGNGAEIKEETRL